MKKTLYILSLIMATLTPSLRAQSVFTPETYFNVNHQNYIQSLVGDAAAYYVCQPWYDNDYALSVQGDTLVLVRAESKRQRHCMVLSKKEKMTIYQLLEAVTKTANFFEQDGIGCDGTTYTIYCLLKTVSVWSPEEGSRSFRTVMMMDSLCYAVEHGSRAVLLRQITTCRELTKEFRELYPLSYFEPQLGRSCFEPISMSLCAHKLCVEWETKDGERLAHLDTWEKAYPQDMAYAEALHDSVQLWSRYLFLHLEDDQVSVVLCDTVKRSTCEAEEPCYKSLVLRESDLRRDVLLKASSLAQGDYYFASDNNWHSVSDTLYVEQPKPIVHTNIAEEVVLKMFPVLYYASAALTILFILWGLLAIALIISLIVWVLWEACARNGWHFKRHFLPILVYVSIVVFGMFAATMIVGRCTSLAFIWDSIPIYQDEEGNKDLYFNLDNRKGYINWRWGEDRTITIVRDINAIRIAGDSIYFKTDSVWSFPADSATITVLRNEFRKPNSVLDTVRLGEKVPYNKYIKNIEYIPNPPALTNARWFWWREFFRLAGKWKLLALAILLVVAYYPARAIWQCSQLQK